MYTLAGAPSGVLSPAQTECGRDTTAVLVMCLVPARAATRLVLMVGCLTAAATRLVLMVGCLTAASRFCFCIRTLRTKRRWPTSHRILWNVPVSQTRRATGSKIRRFVALRLGRFSLYFLETSVAFPLHFPDTVCMSANPINEYPLSILAQ
jgi:hypothetical protein